MASITVTVKGDGIARLMQAAKTLSEGRAQSAYRMAINDAGGKSRTATYRALTSQTGLPQKVTRKAMRPSKASNGNLRYQIEGTGGDIALKFFKARETRRGVSAAPFNNRQVFDGTFIKGGRFPGRVDLGKGGAVFERAGASKFPIAKVKSGVVIPAEMVKGATASAFETVGQHELGAQIARQIARATKGVVS